MLNMISGSSLQENYFSRDGDGKILGQSVMITKNILNNLLYHTGKRNRRMNSRKMQAHYPAFSHYILQSRIFRNAVQAEG